MGSCNAYRGNTLRYEGTSNQAPYRPGGLFGFLGNLLGGPRTVAYREASPVPTSAPVVDNAEPAQKAVTVIVALDSQALADAVREQLAALSQNEE